MYPGHVIIQAVAAERSRDMRAHAAVARRLGEARRDAQGRHPRAFSRFSRGGRGPVSRPAPRPLGDPRAA